MSGTVIAIVAGAVVAAVAALVIGTRWVRPNPVAGMIGSSPWFVLYIVIGIPLVA